MSILKRIAGSRFSEVVPAWMDETVVIIGGGPSLTFEQVGLIRRGHEAGRVRIIAVNDAYLLSPWAEVHYAADAKWHAWHTAGIAKPALGLSAAEVRERWAAFAGEKCSIECSGAAITSPRVHVMRNAAYPYHSTGLSLDSRGLITGRNSGFQAFNLATLAGGKTILLVAFDGKPDAQGKNHWFGEHPSQTNPLIYEEIRRAFSAAERAIAAAGVRVINCSPGSAIDSFPKMELEKALSCVCAAVPA